MSYVYAHCNQPIEIEEIFYRPHISAEEAIELLTVLDDKPTERKTKS